ncbi:MAG: DUF362 domain-containing protein, partial [Acidobacteria bacterium]
MPHRDLTLPRRDFVRTVSAGLALAPLAASDVLAGMLAPPRSRVAVVRTADRKQGVTEALKLLDPKGIADKKVVIKPNFMFMHSRHDISTYTDPELVEGLVARIYDQGFTNITLVEAQSTYGNYYKNRDVLSVARYVGYPVNKD